MVTMMLMMSIPSASGVVTSDTNPAVDLETVVWNHAMRKGATTSTRNLYCRGSYVRRQQDLVRRQNSVVFATAIIFFPLTRENANTYVQTTVQTVVRTCAWVRLLPRGICMGLLRTTPTRPHNTFVFATRPYRLRSHFFH